MIRLKKIKSNVKCALPQFIEVMRREPKINALYLFGSYARNATKPLSDIDIAVLLKKNVSAQHYWHCKVAFLSQAVKIFHTDEIDLVILNEAPYDLAHGILKEGKAIFCHDEAETIDFQEVIISRYLDTRHLRDEIFFHVTERISTGRFAYDERKF